LLADVDLCQFVLKGMSTALSQMRKCTRSKSGQAIPSFRTLHSSSEPRDLTRISDKPATEKLLEITLKANNASYRPLFVASRCLVYPSSFRGRTKVELDFFYLVSLKCEEFRVPRAAAVFGFAVIAKKNQLFLILPHGQALLIHEVAVAILGEPAEFL
jgi:hypothetical protein